MKTSELEGDKLDYWVAKAMGGPRFDGPWHPSTDWEEGGPIIERELISIVASKYVDRFERECVPPEERWTASVGPYSHYIDDSLPGFGGHGQVGPTPLIAAMRSYVESKYGEDVPEE